MVPGPLDLPVPGDTVLSLRNSGGSQSTVPWMSTLRQRVVIGGQPDEESAQVLNMKRIDSNARVPAVHWQVFGVV